LREISALGCSHAASVADRSGWSSSGYKSDVRLNHYRTWSQGDRRESVLVFIGRKLPRELFEKGLDPCLG
jgi:hypothetical protein